MSEFEKYQQICREAGWTGVALLVLVVFWLVAGFGLSGIEGEVLGLPVWALTSSIGVWLFAIVLVKLLLMFVFKDMDLNEMDEEKDCLRFYYLGANWRNKVEHVGTKPAYDPEGPLIL